MTWTVSILTIAATWPSSNLQAVKQLVMSTMCDFLRSVHDAGYGSIVDRIYSVHARFDTSTGSVDAHPLRLTITLNEADNILDCLAKLLFNSPLLVSVPAGSFAQVVEEEVSSSTLLLKVNVFVPASSWLGELMDQKYTFLRVSPGGSMGRDFVRGILQQFNAHCPTGPMFDQLLSFDADRSQAIMLEDVEVPGNDYVALVSGCKQFDRITFEAPVKRLLQQIPAFQPVAAAFPETKRFTISRLSFYIGGVAAAQRKKRGLSPAAAADPECQSSQHRARHG